MTDANSEKGLPIYSPEEIGYGYQGIYLGINPQKETNYRDALSYLEGVVLKRPGFFEKSDADIVAIIMKTNEIIEKKTFAGSGKFNDIAINLDEDKLNLKECEIFL